MEDALEPVKKRTRGMGAVTKVDISRPRGPLFSTVSQTQGHTAAQKGPKKAGPRGCSTVGTVLRNQKPAPTVPAQKPGTSTAPVVVRKRPGKRPCLGPEGPVV
jgi:kinesin family protein C1